MIRREQRDLLAAGQEHIPPGLEPVELDQKRQRLLNKMFGIDQEPVRLGRYLLGDMLGSGGMGVVYTAHDPKLDRRVAVKLLKTAGRGGQQRRLMREAMAMAKLSHPNVVPIYEIGERDDSTFIVMEYVEGQTLRAWQERERTWAAVLAVYKAAARGLIAAHQKQIVHRDFKPDNVMIGDDDRVRVMDFGLASAASQLVEAENGDELETSEASAFSPLTCSGTLLGTPAYMSPEQFEAKPADAGSDQFSFCVALYEALYGERPFASATLKELYLAVTRGELREPSKGASVPDWLREVVCRGLAVDPAERFGSMQALLDAIVEGELSEDMDEREPPAYVFVAHDSRDKQKVLRLCEGLLDHGVRPWLDMWEGHGADAKSALSGAPAVIVCGGTEHTEELVARIERDPATVYVARFGGAGELGLSDQYEGVELDEVGWDDAVLELARLVGIDHERVGWLERETARAGVERGELSPYRGLEAFHEQDARWMFGRDEEVAALLELIRADQTRFLTLIGASGSGKSSLLMGGVCPMLRHGVLGDGVDWRIAYLRPGPRPCEALAHAIFNLEASGDAVENSLKIKRLRGELLGGGDTLRLLLSRRTQGRVLLVIDQLEELFTEADLGGKKDEADEALAFVQNLVETTQELAGFDGNLWIAATLRADFVQRGLEIPELARALQVGTYFALPPMSEKQIRAAVERPAARVGYRVESRLVDKLVVAAAHQAGRLPLLQHVLRELWARRDEDRRLLSDAAYAETGGIEGTIAVAAQRALDGLRDQFAESGELATRRLMTRLVHLGNRTSEDTRRRVDRTELGNDTMTQRVLEAFVREARVLVAAEVEQVDTVEIAHEALLREWTTLVEWLNADREALRLRQELARDAANCELASENEYLWGRGRIEEARRVLDASVVELNELECEFLEASERVVRRRRRRVQAGVVGVLSIAMTVIVVVGGQKAEVERQKTKLEAKNKQVVEEKDRANRELIKQKGQRASMLAKSSGNELAALKLAVDAIGGSEEAPTRIPEPVLTGLASALMRIEAGLTLWGHDDKVVAIAYSPDGLHLATASLDKTVRLWNANSGALVQTLGGHELEVRAVAFARDGLRLATASEDKTARIWDVISGKELAKFVHEEEIFDVAFSPDGTRAATAGSDGVHVWNAIEAKELLRIGHEELIRAVDWSPDGSRLATASDNGKSLVWNASNGELLSSFVGHGGKKLLTVAWSPDSAYVATGGYDGTARMWDAETGDEIACFEHGETVQALAFSADGKYLATGVFDDDAAHLWEVSSVARVRSFRHAGPVMGVAWSPDGTKLATVSWDKTAKSWNLGASPAMRRLEGHRQGVYAIAASSDGSRIATGSGDDTARLWDANAGKVIAELRGHKHDLSAVSFSGDGAMLATASWDGTVRLWDAQSGAFVRTLRGHEGRVQAVAFSPDGLWVATASTDKSVRIWDRASGAVTHTLAHDSSVVDVLFTPSSTQLFSVTAADTSHLWSSTSGKKVVFGYDGPLTAAAFSADGVRLALATKDNGIVLWNLQTNVVEKTYVGHSAPVRALAFSGTGDLLASASEDETARVWETSTGEEQFSLVHEGQVFDLAFSADEAALLTASGDDVARVWSLVPGQWLKWGCVILETRHSLDDAMRGACKYPYYMAIGDVMADPNIIDGDASKHDVIVEHGVEYVFVPGGTFMMGSVDGVGDDNEHPRHEVILDSFYMARTELTNAQYELFLDENPHATKIGLWADARWNQPNQPVIGLNWADARAYCDWADCRLPTEAQWEYAARAGTRTAFWFGDDHEESDRFAWHVGNSGDRPHSVAKQGANPFGLFDMTGNLYEWVLDNGDYTIPARAGDGLRHQLAGRNFAVLRGGCWGLEARLGRSAARVKNDPNLRFWSIGFRPLKAVP